jgi:hypothetical protein
MDGACARLHVGSPDAEQKAARCNAPGVESGGLRRDPAICSLRSRKLSKLTPLEFCLEQMRDTDNPPAFRLECAKAAMAYVHAKKAEEPGEKPVVIEKSSYGRPADSRTRECWCVGLSYRTVKTWLTGIQKNSSARQVRQMAHQLLQMKQLPQMGQQNIRRSRPQLASSRSLNASTSKTIG